MKGMVLQFPPACRICDPRLGYWWNFQAIADTQDRRKRRANDEKVLNGKTGVDVLLKAAL